MKKVLTFVACFFITVLLFLSCNKNKVPPPPPPPLPVAVNQPPTARAGADSTLTLSSCGAQVFVLLDGSKSSDPENDIRSAAWRIISGPEFVNFIIGKTLNSAVILKLKGVYSIELSIVDGGNLTSKDTLTVTLIGATPKEYDFDITSNTTYTFHDNIQDYYDGYIDYTEIRGVGTFVPIGLFLISVYEQTDTAASKYATSYLSVSNDNYIYTISGSTSINFKKLIQQGGGAFNGNFTVTEGSAKKCDANIYNSLAPLLVTGNLDTTTKKVSIRIKGKTFF